MHWICPIAPSRAYHTMAYDPLMVMRLIQWVMTSMLKEQDKAVEPRAKIQYSARRLFTDSCFY